MTEHEPTHDRPGNPDDLLVGVDWNRAQTLIQQWKEQRISVAELLEWLNHRSERLDALRSLIELSAPMRALAGKILGTREDADLIYITLDWRNVQTAIQKFVNGEIDAAELIDWANCIEGRFDIEYRESTQVDRFIRSISNSSPERLSPFEIDELLSECRAPFGLTTNGAARGEPAFRANDRRP